MSQSLRIPGQIEGDLNELLMVLRDQLGQPQVRQRAGACSRAVGVAGHRDHRHTHPEGVAACCVAVEGEWIQCDIDRVVAVVILGTQPARKEIDSIGTDAMRFKRPDLLLTDTRRVTGQNDAGIGNLLEEPCPQGNNAMIELGGMIQTSESEPAISLGGQLPHRRRLTGWLEAEKTGQPHKLFGIERLILPRRIGDRVGDAITHRIQPGGVQPTEITRLHRRWPAGKGEHSILSRMTGKIDDDVFLGAVDFLRKFQVIQVGGVVPAVGICLKSPGDIVGPTNIRIAGDDKLFPIMRSKYRLKEIRHRMLTKIRRNIRDAQRPIGIAAVLRGKSGDAVIVDTDCLKLPVLFKEQLTVNFWIVVQGKNQVASGLGEIRHKFQCVARRGNRLRNITGAKQSHRKIHPCPDEIRFDLDGSARQIDGLIVVSGEKQRVGKLTERGHAIWINREHMTCNDNHILKVSLELENTSQVCQRLNVCWCKLNGIFYVIQGFIQTPLHRQRPAKVHVGIGVVWIQLHSAVAIKDGFVKLSNLRQCHAKAIVCAGQTRIDLHCFLKQGNGIHQLVLPQVGPSESFVCSGKVGAHRDGQGKSICGFSRTLQILQHQANIKMESGVVGVQRHGALKIGQRLLVSACVSAQKPVIAVKICSVGRQLQRAVYKRFGRRCVATARQQQSQHMKAVWFLWLRGKDRTIDPFGFIELARDMKLNRLLDCRHVRARHRHIVRKDVRPNHNARSRIELISPTASLTYFPMPKVRKAVITAAGRGTRQYPASTAVQKEMFPLVDRDGLTKPVIQIIGEEAIDSGIEQVCIITGPGEEKQYREYFKRLDENMLQAFRGKDWALLASEKLGAFGERLSFAEQLTPEGFGHAVYQAKKFAGDEPFLLLLGDHVFISNTTDRCARQVTRVFEEYDCDAVTAVQLTTEPDLHLFGTIRGKPIDENRGVHQAELIIEKPAIEVARQKLTTPGLPGGNYLSHFGMHVFSPRIFDSLEYLIKNNLREKGEFQLTAAQEHLRQTGNKYFTAIVQGQRYDTGIPYGLMESQLALALNSVHKTEICQAITRIMALQIKS